MGVKTVEEACALHEIDSRSLFNGPLAGSGIEGDDIILFVDSDGRSMQVVETHDGPKKMRFDF